MRIPAKIAMIATTIISSISVNPRSLSRGATWCTAVLRWCYEGAGAHGARGYAVGRTVTVTTSTDPSVMLKNRPPPSPRVRRVGVGAIA